MRSYLAILAVAGASVIAACGGNASSRTATPTKPTATASPSVGTPAPTPMQATPTTARSTATPAPTTSASPAAESGVEGLVTIGPTCPVQRIDSPCPDRPFAADIVVLDNKGKRVATVSSGADGRFRILLPPGLYTLSPQHKSVPPTAPEQTITVIAGRLTAVQIVYDSGIR